MNYIKRLEKELAEERQKIANASEIIGDLKSYLQSTKFHNDTTVQVQDVLNRINPASRELLFG